MLTAGGGLFGLALIAVALLLAPARGSSIVQADQNSDASLLELVQRYIQRDSGGPVDFLPAAMPGDVPVALPLPSGSRLIGSVTRHGFARSTTWEVIFDVASGPSDVATFYEQAMKQIGWAPPPPIDYTSFYAPVGFQDQQTWTPPTRTPVPRTPGPLQSSTLMLCPASGETGFYLSARTMQNGVTSVSVQIDSAGSNCAYLRRLTPTASPPPPVIPALTAPANVAVTSISYEDELDSIAEAVAETDMSPAELQAFYAKQLTASGWIRIAGDARGPLAWSLWNTPKDRQAWFSVLEIAGTTTRDLHIQIGSIGGDDDERTTPAANQSG
jgi:hypothetical protein